MFTIAALYHFTRFDDPAAIKPALAKLCCAQGVTGTLLLAGEGINGTIAGSRTGIDAVLAHIRSLPGCAGLEWKESTASAPPFARMKVRLKREIVTMGQPDVDPVARTGHYVDPADWNALITAPDARLPRMVGGEQTPFPQQADRDVLHRRHPLREEHELPVGAGGGGGLSPKGRYSEIP